MFRGHFLARIVATFSVVGMSAIAQSAIAEDAPVLSLRLPPELMWHFHDGSADLSNALVDFSDGTAAVQATAQIGASGPHGGYDLWESWLLILNRDGHQVREVHLPEMQLKGATAVRGLPNGGVLLMLSFKGTVYLSEVSREGSLIWERMFDSGTFGFISAPAVLRDGGYILLEDYLDTCSLRRLDEHGQQLWQREFGSPDPRSKQLAVWDGIVTPLPDGGFIFDCAFPIEDSDSVDSWVFRVDAHGNTVWHRRIGVSALTARTHRDNVIEYLGWVIPTIETNREVPIDHSGGWASMFVDLGSGAVLRTEWKAFPPTLTPNFGPNPSSDIGVPPTGGLMFASRSPYTSDSWSALRVARLNPAYSLLWERPVLAMLGNYALHPAGIAQLGNGQTIIAVNIYNLEIGGRSAAIYVLAKD